MRLVILFAIILLLGAGCGSSGLEAVPTPVVPHPSPLPQGEREIVARTNFSQFNPIFRFSAELPNTWQVEYVREIEALNVYGPAMAAMPARELSKIFIRYFAENDFLTLRTVDILKREALEVQGHAAVRYEIKKKAGVPDFPHQPSWRNEQHEVTDVRFTARNPSAFYVFAQNPELPRETLERFLSSLVFHNDRTSFQAPLDRAQERITKKPFGLKVVPENSPVQPERFSGYHTGVDFEVFADESDKAVEVRAFCGGLIREKRTAEGYGGVVVQECMLGDETVTVVYGHLKLDPHLISPLVKGEKEGVGEYLAPGDALGTLGAAFSAQTGGERKHLHFGIHKGTRIDLSGYVDTKDDLDQWLDPWQYITTR